MRSSLFQFELSFVKTYSSSHLYDTCTCSSVPSMHYTHFSFKSGQIRSCDKCESESEVSFILDAVAKRYFVPPPPPADCNLPPLFGAGSLRSPKFVRRDTILFSSNLS